MADGEAFIESATLTKTTTKVFLRSSWLGRSHGSSSTDEAYAGAFFNDAHLATDPIERLPSTTDVLHRSRAVGPADPYLL